MSRVATLDWSIGPALALVVTAAAAVAVAACGASSTTETLVPITGITVRAETLTADLGCGPTGAQILKYGVVVFGRNPSTPPNLPPNVPPVFDTYVASNVYDCFSDAQFVDLPPSGGTTDYMLQIYAYSATSYQAAGGDAVVPTAVRNPSTLPATNPTYTTTCSAVEIGDVQALAACKPLSLGASGVGTAPPPTAVTLGAGSFPHGSGPEARTASCDGEYATVRYRATPMGGAGAPGPITDVRCSHVTPNGVEPVTISISPAVPLTTYRIEVALLRGDGSLFGQTTCTADTSPGLTSSAVCLPVP